MSGPSAWAPLRHRPFRALWLATVVANLAVWMQNIGAAWMMTELAASPLMVALVQTAMALPAFVLGMPSGVIADLMDKRRLLLITQGLALLSMILLCIPALVGNLGPVALLAYTFALGSASALSMSAWLACTIEHAPPGQTAAAIALGTVSPNIARVLGPALAGAIIARVGTPLLFVLVCACMASVIALLTRLGTTAPTSRLPSEHFLPAIVSGLRYVRHSPSLCRDLGKVAIFSTAGSALWALLPLIARERLGLAADGYGILLGCLGAGAVVAALRLPDMYRRHPLQRIVFAGGIGFAAVTLLSGAVTSLTLLGVLYVLGGMAWMAVNTTLMTVIQTSTALWVKARVGSIYLMLIMGGMATGGVLWGLIAARLGVASTLITAGLVIAAGTFLSLQKALHLGREEDFAPPTLTLRTQSVLDITPGKGRVCVEVSYHVAEPQRDEFILLAHAVGRIRRRNGACDWHLQRDLTHPDHYTERFIVDSWLTYRRQQERSTAADALQEERLQRFLAVPDQLARHYLIVQETS
ncbi:MAG: MFS transporter [Zoogloea sp.]|nr:MFS transporter [Zoogloea sp.]MCA0189001.1 MFS transporter [Pseudomonadota bacterium]